MSPLGIRCSEGPREHEPVLHGACVRAPSLAQAWDSPPVCRYVLIPAACTLHVQRAHAQVFMVTGCQPQSLEVQIGDKQFMLSTGDHFVVPSRTVYALRNHSPSTSCDIGFFIMKHPARQ